MCSPINKQVNWACLDSLLSKFSSKTNCSSIVAQTRCNWWYSWCLNRGDVKTGANVAGALARWGWEAPGTLKSVAFILIDGCSWKKICMLHAIQYGTKFVARQEWWRATHRDARALLTLLRQHPLTVLASSLSVAWISKRLLLLPLSRSYVNKCCSPSPHQLSWALACIPPQNGTIGEFFFPIG
jgi:hypothetical protein